MVADTVELGGGYVLSISAPKDDGAPWSLDLARNGEPWGTWTLPDIDKDDPTDLETMIELAKSWLYSRIGRMVDEKSNEVKDTLTRLVNEYRC